MKKICISLLFLSFVFTSVAQEEGVEIPIEGGRRAARMPGLFGKVIENDNKKGISSVTVEVFIKKPGSGADAGYDSLIAGMLTQPNGEFGFVELPVPDSFSVRFSSVGYTTKMEFVHKKTGMQGNDRGLDMGNIRLDKEVTSLQEVRVVATKPVLEMGIDRKIFTVDKSITSAGGTAIDVMRNIPSVTVDVNGDVQLRNSSPQIFVDGRPTILTLQQIPADDIERIELITNPSAKFDASTSGGIINVVLKKSRRSGLNGVATIGGGYPQVLTGNLSLNMRQGKWNFFASGNYNQSGGRARSSAQRQNKDNGKVTDYFNQETITDISRRFISARFGADYFINNRNTITISQNFVNGRFENEENQDQQYLDINRTLYQIGERTTDSRNQFKRSNTQLNYRFEFPKSGHELTADVTYNRGSGNSNSSISNYYFLPGGASAKDPNFVRNDGRNKSYQLTIQSDYVNPLSDSAKLEMGVRAFINDNTNVLDAFSLANGGEFKLPLSTNVKYKEQVYGAYTTYTNVLWGIRYQLGLRAEYSKFEGVLVDSARTFGYTLPSAFGDVFGGLFPSLFLTKKVGEDEEIQLNFSRRIRRPDFWQLNPYFNVSDPLNISVGNPELRPEYINAFEFNYGRQIPQGSILAVLYFHNNNKDITRYSDTITPLQYQQLNNAAIEPNAILTTFVNAQYTNRMGAELTFQKKFGNLEVIPNVNLQYRQVKARINDLNLDNQGFNWEAKLITNYSTKSKSPLWNDFNFQLTGEYESAEVIPQGRNKAQFVVDFALRKEFLKKKAAAITFAINDVFNTNRWGQIYDTEYFYQDSYRRWRVRTYRLTFTYRFGNRDFQMFGRDNRSREPRDD